MATQDKGKKRKNMKEQFYTKKEVAKECVDSIISRVGPDYTWIEPSAGQGVFLTALPTSYKRVGLDIDPKGKDILKADFLEWTPTTNKNIVFGNPPFGKQSSLAKKFIARAATFSDFIAFILPRSFQKPSMNRAFPLNFHLIYEKDVAQDSFEVNGQPYDVPCIFQIWQKKATNRLIPEQEKEIGFTYVKEEANPHIACRRVGVNAGKCYAYEADKYSPQSHYFISLAAEYEPSVKKIIDAMSAYEFPSNTVGPRSLSKGEINEVLNIILLNN